MPNLNPINWITGALSGTASLSWMLVKPIIVAVFQHIFEWIGTALSGVFLAELGMVESFAKDANNINLGGSFAKLMAFNAAVIPALAVVVFLVWLIAKGLAGGNSKASMEEMLKRVMGAMVVSFVLSLLIPPVEQVIGALDGVLWGLVGVGSTSHGLAMAFGELPVAVAPTGVGDSFIVVVIILFLGLLLAGLLIFMLILAHAVAFLLIYFAPYLTLFRKEGFREAVEGVTAALSLPFIITSILAIGIATMGATGTLQSSAPTLGHATTTLSGMIGGHSVSIHTMLAGNTTTTPPTPTIANYLSNVFAGLLILAAAVMLPKFILGMVFQAGAAMHNAFRSAHQESMSMAKGLSGKGKAAFDGVKNKKTDKASGSSAVTSGGQATVTSGGQATDRDNLAEVAERGATVRMNGGGPSVGGTVGGGNGSYIQTVKTPGGTGKAEAASETTKPGQNESGQSSADNAATSPVADPTATTTSGEAPTEQTPLVEPATTTPEETPPSESQIEPNTRDAALASVSESGDQTASSNDSVSAKTSMRTKVAHHIVDRQKASIRAIPTALLSMPKMITDNPLETAFGMHAAFRAAKGQSLQQVKQERARREAKSVAPTSKGGGDIGGGGGDGGASDESTRPVQPESQEPADGE